MKAQTLTWWTFETSPMHNYGADAPALLEVNPDYETGFPGQEVSLTPAGEELPEDVGARLLRLVAKDLDAGSCEVNACGFSREDMNQARPNTVGYALSGDADENMDWHPVTVVKIPDGRLVLACEDCEPHIAYIEEAPSTRIDSRLCEEAGEHQVTTRHPAVECPAGQVTQ